MQQIEELFTFKNFIINKSNQLAYNVLKKESIAYETIYNPLLFIYGSTGSGKTHLLKAFAHNCSNYSSKTIYVNAEDLTNEFTINLKNQTIDRFRNKYRGIDIFIIDDMQNIWGKEQIQKELYHTITDLILKGKKVVLAGTISPYYQNGLIADLAFYLLGSMIMKID